MALIHSKRWFPCPVCAEPREIRATKNGKPYVTCDPCGVQLFVRGRVGIERFTQLLERANSDGPLARFAEIERRYRLTCPTCGDSFWITPSLIETSWFDGSLQGVSHHDVLDEFGRNLRALERCLDRVRAQIVRRDVLE